MYVVLRFPFCQFPKYYLCCVSFVLYNLLYVSFCFFVTFFVKALQTLFKGLLKAFKRPFKGLLKAFKSACKLLQRPFKDVVRMFKDS